LTQSPEEPTQEQNTIDTNPALEQHFLVSPHKLKQLIDAADIRPQDHVLEIGAGIGTVAKTVPECRSLTLIELDPQLIPALRTNAPHARIIQADALKIVPHLHPDVLLSNLPRAVTDQLLPLLPTMNFRTAVLAIGDTTNLRTALPGFTTTEITTITGEDFQPPQPTLSRLVKITPPPD
jgi:16S rRNA A1518/A1519 N6-dimethyltransferase RsmA/KsgA/DIM1 with predicted DNA glycosylase/AP lyase activity